MDNHRKITAGELCPYCQEPTSRMESGQPGAPRLRPGRKAMVCPRCGAYVYCHPLSDIPLGSVATAELRRLRWEAHRVFELLWRMKLKRSRYNAYSWLSLRLGLSKDVTHMGLFDEATCLRAIAVCTDYLRSHLPADKLPEFLTPPSADVPGGKMPPI